MRYHLKKLAYAKPYPDLDARIRLEQAPKLPPLCLDLWALYSDLNARRQFNEHGAVRFTWTDLKHFCDVTGKRFNQWQLDAIAKLENAYFAVELASKPKK